MGDARKRHLRIYFRFLKSSCYLIIFDLFSLAEQSVVQVYQESSEILCQRLFTLSQPLFFRLFQTKVADLHFIMTKNNCCRCCASELVGFYIGYGMRKELLRKLNYICPYAKKHCSNLIGYDYKAKMAFISIMLFSGYC